MTNTTERFTDFVLGAPDASDPGPTDYVAITQGGRTKRIPVSAFAPIREPTVITAGPTYTLAANDAFLAVSKASVTTILLTSGLVSGRSLIVADCGGYAGSYPITVAAGAGDTIDGEDIYPMISAWQVIGLQYIPSLHLWKVF